MCVSWFRKGIRYHLQLRTHMEHKLLKMGSMYEEDQLKSYALKFFSSSLAFHHCPPLKSSHKIRWTFHLIQHFSFSYLPCLFFLESSGLSLPCA